MSVDAGPETPRISHPRLVARRWRLSLGKKLAWPRVARLLPKVPVAARAAAAYRDRLDRIEVPVCGAPFRLDVAHRSVSRSLYLGGRWHLPVVEAIRRHVEPGMTVLDAGANVGLMAIHAGDRAGPDGTVLACEPEARNFAVLSLNARRCRWRNVVPLPVALGSRAGTATLWLAEDGGDHRTVGEPTGRTGVPVPVTTVDDLAARRGVRIHFAKLDVQGAETEILRGMTKTLASEDLRGLVLEWWPHALREAGEEPDAPLALLREAGFSCENEPRADLDLPSLLARMSEREALDLVYVR